MAMHKEKEKPAWCLWFSARIVTVDNGIRAFLADED
jgi:hypothetical protein